MLYIIVLFFHGSFLINMHMHMYVTMHMHMYVTMHLSNDIYIPILPTIAVCLKMVRTILIILYKTLKSMLFAYCDMNDRR